MGLYNSLCIIYLLTLKISSYNYELIKKQGPYYLKMINWYITIQD